MMIIFFILHMANPLPVSFSFSTTIAAKDGHILEAYLSKDDKWRMKLEPHEINDPLKKIILFKEDKWFYYHAGVNPVSILRAIFHNTIYGKRTSGASTITMQVARLLNPKERTYSNKLFEMFRAMQLECMYTKDEILQLYMSLIPYGGNIEGIKSAALLYMNKLPTQLSLAEMTALAIIPNRPTSLRIGKRDEALLIERNKWLEKMKANNLFNEDQINDAIEEPIQATRVTRPQLAPHLGRKLHSTYPQAVNILTSIDLEKQTGIQEIVSNYVKRIQNLEIYNAAAMVINNETGEVEAYIGSADYFSALDGGQVDGTQALRSPGSTLKPYIYAIAMDKGLITPKTIIADMPVNLGGYAPENFDNQFNGPVTAEFALINSLNIPAVKLLDQINFKDYLYRMKKAGFGHIEAQESGLGLSLALGGCGVTLEELCRLYATIANDGFDRPLSYMPSDNCPIETALLSPSASHLVREILSGLTRPDLPNNYQNNSSLHRIAWKTGTSYGRRDAWSIGITPYYTIGVWVGNFSGKSSSYLTGAEIASPLLFEIANTIHKNLPKKWFTKPKEIEWRYVCSQTGKLPSAHCENKLMDAYILEKSSQEICTHLKSYYVDPAMKISYCTACMPDSGAVSKLFPNLPPEILSWYRDQHLDYEQLPPHNPSCERVYGKDAPQIISPVNRTEYLIDVEDHSELLLAAHSAIDVSMLYWFIDDRFVTQSSSGEQVFYSPQQGHQKITCVDDKGRKTSITIKVKLINQNE